MTRTNHRAAAGSQDATQRNNGFPFVYIKRLAIGNLDVSSYVQRLFAGSGRQETIKRRDRGQTPGAGAIAQNGKKLLQN